MADGDYVPSYLNAPGQPLLAIVELTWFGGHLHLARSARGMVVPDGPTEQVPG
jgi:hypothetical protein